MLCRYPLFIVAPEGTTKHRHCLLTFAKGAFAAGLPVMPVLLKYRSVRLNPGWGIVYTAWHFFRVCNQYVNHLEVDVLPIYRPSAGMMLSIQQQLCLRLGQQQQPKLNCIAGPIRCCACNFACTHLKDVQGNLLTTFIASRSLTQPLLDCMLYLTQKPGILPSSANQCILRNGHLRSNLLRNLLTT